MYGPHDVRVEERPDPQIIEPTDAVNDALDSAYRTKYHRYASYVPPMLSPEARAATLRLVPRA